ncbi:MAG: hypothetical protein A2W22_00235 [Candidatus Levybacteria bacterium RBG_16_35_11]|nr:MAG: hypothetical protein A2W22_00235 [Candidatus Levybacteria bacterium RBG_16_35_11]
MSIVRGVKNRTSEFSDLIKFLWKVKLWFLIPFIIILIIFGMILIFAQSTGIAPFIYTII